MATSLSSLCDKTTFNSPSVFGAEIFAIEANLVSNFSTSVPEVYRFTQPAVELQNATFCNVTVFYTHPGQNDNISVETWLPVDNWNGRLQAVGGGGWVAGRFSLSYGTMYGAIADGYATITTDAGVGNSGSADPWALLSPGNVNLYNLQNLASVSLNDEAIIGKSLIKSFYGRGPDFSYWNGCSQGGRQGLMLAQRYPTAYDGIAAGAPGIYWTDFIPSIQWPQQVMNMLGEYPHGCEMDAITSAAISMCDGLDGVIDGVITEPDACLDVFNPFTLVGTTINCNQTGETTQISNAAATVVNATWQGIVTEQGKKTWFGLNPGADLTGNMLYSSGDPGIAATNCSSGTCVGVPTAIGLEWLQLFAAMGADFNATNLTHTQFDDLVYAGQQRFRSTIGTDDADLTRFRDAGGKLVVFHGIQDLILPPKGSEKYYREVSALVPDIHDFYRYFEVPGLGHCGYGPSGLPTGLFDQLRAWVENGTAPEHTSVQLKGLDGEIQNRILCPYPQKAKFDEPCGDPANSKCWFCHS
ncbi:tannase and feruloyl esterase [Annulohypoxylon bovei var. microspora]|nr:tannase and feruloyl esterase [Annulohypoxylon bovei var. microspora]